jgi:NADPH-dependent curcumin reductase CurA
VLRPKKGDTLFVSAASGAVGALVGQIAKLEGCIVIGSAGGAKKNDYIRNTLGYDFAIDYKVRKNSLLGHFSLKKQ